METTTKRGPGRPKGTYRTIYDKPRAIRFTGPDLERMRRLAEKLTTSESEIVRQAVREKSEREGIG